LVAATWHTESFASPLDDEDAKRKQYGVALDGITEYFRFFDQHRIFLPAELCPSLEELAKKLRYPTIMFGTYLSIEHPTDKTVEEKRKAWMDAWDSVKNEVPAMRAAIEDEFRKLLGAVSGPAS